MSLGYRHTIPTITDEQGRRPASWTIQLVCGGCGEVRTIEIQAANVVLNWHAGLCTPCEIWLGLGDGRVAPVAFELPTFRLRTGAREPEVARRNSTSGTALKTPGR